MVVKTAGSACRELYDLVWRYESASWRRLAGDEKIEDEEVSLERKEEGEPKHQRESELAVTPPTNDHGNGRDWLMAQMRPRELVHIISRLASPLIN
jgi:hypothetical protein